MLVYSKKASIFVVYLLENLYIQYPIKFNLLVRANGFFYVPNFFFNYFLIL